MARQSKISLSNFRTWDKRLRGPVSATFLALWMLVVWAVYGHAKPTLPSNDVPVVLCSNQAQDNMRTTLKEAILQAKESIVLIIFSLTDNDMIAALKKKAEEGVDVLVIHDAVATQDIAFKLGPKVKIKARREKGLMHDKILSIDHKDVWLGSANFTKESLDTHANLMIGIESPQLAEAVEKKADEMLQRSSYKSLPIYLKTKNQEIELWFLPDARQALEHLIDVLNTAKKSIRVAMFTFTHPLLLQALIDAHKRGVDVEVVIDSDSAKQTSQKVFQRLKREGMKVFVSQRVGLLHHKTAIIDDNILVVGSANWTRAAFTANDDNICFVIGLTKEQREKLDELWTTTMNEAKPSFSSKKK